MCAGSGFQGGVRDGEPLEEKEDLLSFSDNTSLAQAVPGSVNLLFQSCGRWACDKELAFLIHRGFQFLGISNAVSFLSETE